VMDRDGKVADEVRVSSAKAVPKFSAELMRTSKKGLSKWKSNIARRGDEDEVPICSAEKRSTHTLSLDTMRPANLPPFFVPACVKDFPRTVSPPNSANKPAQQWLLKTSRSHRNTSSHGIQPCSCLFTIH
jgi:hypothetical protein